MTPGRVRQRLLPSSSTFGPQDETFLAATVGWTAWLVSAALVGLAALFTGIFSAWMPVVLGTWVLDCAGFAFWLLSAKSAAPARAALGAAIAGVVVSAAIALVAPGSEFFWAVLAAQALAAASSVLYLRRLDRDQGGTARSRADR